MITSLLHHHYIIITHFSLPNFQMMASNVISRSSARMQIVHLQPAIELSEPKMYIACMIAMHIALNWGCPQIQSCKVRECKHNLWFLFGCFLRNATQLYHSFYLCYHHGICLWYYNLWYHNTTLQFHRWFHTPMISNLWYHSVVLWHARYDIIPLLYHTPMKSYLLRYHRGMNIGLISYVW